MSGLARLLESQGRLDEAEPLLIACMKSKRKQFGFSNIETVSYQTIFETLNFSHVLVLTARRNRSFGIFLSKTGSALRPFIFAKTF